jgi:hypothetical protein
MTPNLSSLSNHSRVRPLLKSPIASRSSLGGEGSRTRFDAQAWTYADVISFVIRWQAFGNAPRRALPQLRGRIAQERVPTILRQRPTQNIRTRGFISEMSLRDRERAPMAQSKTPLSNKRLFWTAVGFLLHALHDVLSQNAISTRAHTISMISRRMRKEDHEKSILK